MRMITKPINPFGRRGIVKSYQQKTYGFIADEESRSDVYVHVSHIENGRVDSHNRTYLKIGDVVEYDIVEDRTGLHAANVVLVKNKE